VDPVVNSSESKIAVDFVLKSEETVSEIDLLTFSDLKCLFKGNICIKLHIEGGHHVGPVNFNLQINKRGREQEDEERPMPDRRHEKRQRQ
jgi:hypothetical protein